MPDGLKRGNAKLRARIRRRRFVQKFINGGPDVAGQQTKVAIAAGLGGTPGASAVAATRIMRQPETQAAIRRALDLADATDARITQELTRIALGDPREVQEWGEDWHRFVPSALLDNNGAATIQGVSSEKTESITETGVRSTTRLKLYQYDKVAALALLTKIRGMVKTKMELTGRDGGPIEHAVRFYLPAPARVREPVVIDAAALPEAPQQNGGKQNGRDSGDNQGYTENGGRQA